MEWFVDLIQGRTYQVMSGMGGGGVIYSPIPLADLEAWGRISGNHPSQWEISTLRKMDLKYVAEKSKQSGSSSEGKHYQGIGEYCNGADEEDCRKTFGDSLATQCSTCPN